jgi:hypothetical protein
MSVLSGVNEWGILVDVGAVDLTALVDEVGDHLIVAIERSDLQWFVASKFGQFELVWILFAPFFYQI